MDQTIPQPPSTTTAFKVFMRGLVVDAQIGIYRHERNRTQPLVVDVEVALAPVEVHGLADILNYETLASAARKLAAEGHIDLVETYVQRLAAACLADERVLSVRVRVEKPMALPGAQAAGVEVVVDRS